MRQLRPVCWCVYECGCLCVFICVCMVCVGMYGVHMSRRICMHVCMYVYACVHVYVYVYVYA